MSVSSLNPARLNELIHQRQLLREHLAWLDREIARESGIAAPNTPLVSTPVTVTVATPSPDPVGGLEGYAAPDPKTTAADAKKGCFFAAILVLTLFAAGLIGIYFWKYRDRPLFFATPDASSRKENR